MTLELVAVLLVITYSIAIGFAVGLDIGKYINKPINVKNMSNLELILMLVDCTEELERRQGKEEPFSDFDKKE